MPRTRVVFVTHRGERHQQAALDAAPPGLDIHMLRSPSRAEILAALPEADVLVSERSGDIDAEMIAAAPRLRLIQRLGTRLWDIDLAAARAAGVAVSAMPVRSCMLVAEHMTMLLIALARRLPELSAIANAAGDWGEPRLCDENYFAYNWSGRTRIGALNGARVGILGFGEIALNLSRDLRGFGAEVLYNKRTPLPAAVEADLGVRFAEKDEIAAGCDFVASLLPNLPGLRGTVGADFLARMRPHAVLAHCGAPGIVDEPALIAALTQGRLGGAALDCFAYEPLRPDDPLLPLARDPAMNLILTPHVGAGTVSANKDERMGDYDDILAVLDGRPPRWQVA